MSTSIEALSLYQKLAANRAFTIEGGDVTIFKQELPKLSVSDLAEICVLVYKQIPLGNAQIVRQLQPVLEEHLRNKQYLPEKIPLLIVYSHWHQFYSYCNNPTNEKKTLCLDPPFLREFYGSALHELLHNPNKIKLHLVATLLNNSTLITILRPQDTRALLKVACLSTTLAPAIYHFINSTLTTKTAKATARQWLLEIILEHDHVELLDSLLDWGVNFSQGVKLRKCAKIITSAATRPHLKVIEWLIGKYGMPKILAYIRNHLLYAYHLYPCYWPEKFTPCDEDLGAILSEAAKCADFDCINQILSRLPQAHAEKMYHTYVVKNFNMPLKVHQPAGTLHLQLARKKCSLENIIRNRLPGITSHHLTQIGKPFNAHDLQLRQQPYVIVKNPTVARRFESIEAGMAEMPGQFPIIQEANMSALVSIPGVSVGVRYKQPDGTMVILSKYCGQDATTLTHLESARPHEFAQIFSILQALHKALFSIGKEEKIDILARIQFILCHAQFFTDHNDECISLLMEGYFRSVGLIFPIAYNIYICNVTRSFSSPDKFVDAYPSCFGFISTTEMLERCNIRASTGGYQDALLYFKEEKKCWSTRHMQLSYCQLLQMGQRPKISSILEKAKAIGDIDAVMFINTLMNMRNKSDTIENVLARNVGQATRNSKALLLKDILPDAQALVYAERISLGKISDIAQQLSVLSASMLSGILPQLCELLVILEGMRQQNIPNANHAMTVIEQRLRAVGIINLLTTTTDLCLAWQAHMYILSNNLMHKLELNSREINFSFCIRRELLNNTMTQSTIAARRLQAYLLHAFDINHEDVQLLLPRAIPSLLRHSIQTSSKTGVISKLLQQSTEITADTLWPHILKWALEYGNVSIVLHCIGLENAPKLQASDLPKIQQLKALIIALDFYDKVTSSKIEEWLYQHYDKATIVGLSLTTFYYPAALKALQATMVGTCSYECVLQTMGPSLIAAARCGDIEFINKVLPQVPQYAQQLYNDCVEKNYNPQFIAAPEEGLLIYYLQNKNLTFKTIFTKFLRLAALLTSVEYPHGTMATMLLFPTTDIALFDKLNRLHRQWQMAVLVEVKMELAFEIAIQLYQLASIHLSIIPMASILLRSYFLAAGLKIPDNRIIPFSEISQQADGETNRLKSLSLLWGFETAHDLIFLCQHIYQQSKPLGTKCFLIREKWRVVERALYLQHHTDYRCLASPNFLPRIPQMLNELLLVAAVEGTKDNLEDLILCGARPWGRFEQGLMPSIAAKNALNDCPDPPNSPNYLRIQDNITYLESFKGEFNTIKNRYRRILEIFKDVEADAAPIDQLATALKNAVIFLSVLHVKDLLELGADPSSVLTVCVEYLGKITPDNPAEIARISKNIEALNLSIPGSSY